jgi:pSer/pThr/pTyr-binding forkhead associated (FHA) protein
MAAKLILSMDGTVIKEYPMNKDRMTIGRYSHNDIVIDNLAVSGEHAAVVTILHDSFLEDLDSTNGLAVNGTPTKKHFLQNNDLIEIGKFKLKFLNDQVSQGSSPDFEKTMVLRTPIRTAVPNPAAPNMEKPREPAGPASMAAEITAKFEPSSPASHAPAVAAAVPTRVQQAESFHRAAVVQILTGPNAGKELELVKNLTTLGKPGLQVAVLTRRPQGFYITYVEGEHFPLVNGKALNNQPQQLNDHDVIELAGIKMEFYFKG